jgi:hypothetical protein
LHFEDAGFTSTYQYLRTEKEKREEAGARYSRVFAEGKPAGMVLCVSIIAKESAN